MVGQGYTSVVLMTQNVKTGLPLNHVNFTIKFVVYLF